MVKFADQSSVLNSQGYWPSYNIPWVIKFSSMIKINYISKNVPSVLVNDSHLSTSLVRKRKRNGDNLLNLFHCRFYKEIYDASGWEESVKRFGDWFTYDRHPRANIFRRDHVKVKDIDSMMKLMRLAECEGLVFKLYNRALMIKVRSRTFWNRSPVLCSNWHTVSCNSYSDHTLW